MLTDQDHAQYVAATLDQFDAFVATAVTAWPHEKSALSAADFRAARYELLKMMNERRDQSTREMPSQAPASNSKNDLDSGQYLPMTPAPWP